MSLTKTDYDIIVAGGGLAGLIVASSAAYYSNQRLKILVIDRNSIDVQGRKTISGWICGDAVGKNTVDYMTDRIKISWGYPEIEHPVKGVVAFSPDHETKVSFDGEGYILTETCHVPHSLPWSSIPFDNLGLFTIGFAST